MIKIYLIVIIYFSTFSFISNLKNEIICNDIVQKDSITYFARTLKLKRAFEQKNFTKFFQLFPNTYGELVDFYGYDDKKGKKPLYDFYKEHINYLFANEEKINPDFFAKKIFNIAKNGVWEADGIGLFQSNLTVLLIHNPNFFLKILSKKQIEEVNGFWQFVFDGSRKYDLQNKEKFEIIYNKINSIDKKQGRILKEEFEKKYK